MRTIERLTAEIRRYRDARWAFIGLCVLLALLIWDALFLNRPALGQVVSGFFNTVFVACLVSAAVLVFGWAGAVGLHFLELKGHRMLHLAVTFVINLIRSVPQVVGVLFCYVLIARLLEKGTLASGWLVLFVMAFCMSLFIFQEMTDLMRDRIAHFQKLDFMSAMRVCGVPESRIINFDVLWKNSRIHILNKLLAVFGMAVFLQCSADFIISVGLSSDVNAVNLPVTLGSLLAKLDSKQDILAIGFTLTHPSYAFKLPFAHLQGLTVAFLIVFTLLCTYRIGSGYAERHRL